MFARGSSRRAARKQALAGLRGPVAVERLRGDLERSSQTAVAAAASKT